MKTIVLSLFFSVSVFSMEIFDESHFTDEIAFTISAETAIKAYTLMNTSDLVSYPLEGSDRHEAPSWVIALDTKQFLIKEKGVPMNVAVDAFINGRTVCDCLAAMKIVMLKSLENFIGTNNFNELFNFYEEYNDVVLFPLHKEGIIQNIIYAEIDNRNVLGTFSYFNNDKCYSIFHPLGASRGQNVVCVGKQNGESIYMGFGKFFKDAKTKSEIKSNLFIDFHRSRSELESIVYDEEKENFRNKNGDEAHEAHLEKLSFYKSYLLDRKNFNRVTDELDSSENNHVYVLNVQSIFAFLFEPIEAGSSQYKLRSKEDLKKYFDLASRIK